MEDVVKVVVCLSHLQIMIPVIVLCSIAFWDQLKRNCAVNQKQCTRSGSVLHTERHLLMLLWNRSKQNVYLGSVVFGHLGCNMLFVHIIQISTIGICQNLLSCNNAFLMWVCLFNMETALDPRLCQMFWVNYGTGGHTRGYNLPYS